MNALAHVGRRFGVQTGALLVVVAAFAVVVPQFRGTAAAYGTLEGVALVGITAIGLAVVMIAGELDLSVGSMAALAGVVAIRAADAGLLAAIVAGTAVGVILGALQGYAVGRLRINSLVLTVGTLILFQGAAMLLTDDRTIGLANFAATDPLLERWWIFTPSSITGIVVIVVIGIFLSRLRRGREIYAIGGSRPEATAAGVPVTASLIVSFALSGGCAALAGSLACLQGGSADPSGFGTLLLGAVSACLIGGISLYGGRGDAVNVALGVLILTVVAAGAAAAGAPSYLTGLIVGALLLIVVTLEFVLNRTLAVSRLRTVRARRAAQLHAQHSLS